MGGMYVYQYDAGLDWGQWTEIRPYVNVSGTWSQLVNIHINVDGTWRPIYTYEWMAGSYGTCSVQCGGGTQTRSVWCTEDGMPVEDALCIAAVGPKPATSQPCNTQSCVSCRYVAPNVARDVEYVTCCFRVPNDTQENCNSHCSGGTYVTNSFTVDFFGQNTPRPDGLCVNGVQLCTSGASGIFPSGWSKGNLMFNNRWNVVDVTVYEACGPF